MSIKILLYDPVSIIYKTYQMLIVAKRTKFKDSKLISPLTSSIHIYLPTYVFKFEILISYR